MAGGDYTTRVGEVPPALGRPAAFDQMTDRLERAGKTAELLRTSRWPTQPAAGDPRPLEGMLDGLYPVRRERLRPLLDETEVMSRLLEISTRS